MLLGVVVLAAVVVYSGSLAAVSWLVVIVVTSAAGFFAVRQVVRGAAEPEPMAARRGPEVGTPGEMQALALAIERARSGSAYSQALVASRLASAFLETVRLARGLSPQDGERARGDRAALRGLIGDPGLADFVFENEPYSRDWPKPPTASAAKEGFGQILSRALDAMEAWS